MKVITYQICSRCVMDTSDPEIEFDEKGICNHCRGYDELVRKNSFSGEEGRKRLKMIVNEIREDGKDKKYDCLIGVSGGVDSSFVAYKVKEAGLRPLAVHLDNGWDTELAVKNIETMLAGLGIDLYTHVIDWEEFRDLQVAFLRASTPDSEIPTDHAIVSLLYQMAEKIGVKYVVIGRNIRTETHIPLAWSQGHNDWKYIRSVHRRFGSHKLRTYPHRTLLQVLRYNRSQKWINILDFVDYIKRDAKQILNEKLCWRDYGGKHYESIYTRFFQGYILPRKFGYDKRRGHFSSLICSGEMSREEALEELRKVPYQNELMEEDKNYVIKKLGLTEEEFDNIMKLTPKTILDYPSYAKINQILKRTPAYHFIRTLFRNKR